MSEAKNILHHDDKRGDIEEVRPVQPPAFRFDPNNPPKDRAAWENAAATEARVSDEEREAERLAELERERHRITAKLDPALKDALKDHVPIGVYKRTLRDWVAQVEMMNADDEQGQA